MSRRIERVPKAQGTTSRRRRRVRMRKRKRKAKFEAIKTLARVPERGRYVAPGRFTIESIPREHRGLRRVDVDLREFVGLIRVHGRRGRGGRGQAGDKGSRRRIMRRRAASSEMLE